MAAHRYSEGETAYCEVKIINVHSTRWLSFSLAIVGWSKPVYRWEYSAEKMGVAMPCWSKNGLRGCHLKSMPRFSPWLRKANDAKKQVEIFAKHDVLPAMLSPNGYDSCCGWILRRRHWHVGRKNCKQCIRKATFSIGMTNLSVDYRRSYFKYIQKLPKCTGTNMLYCNMSQQWGTRYSNPPKEWSILELDH